MYATKAQAVMHYHLRLSRILQIEELAGQMHRLADSYLKEERNHIRLIREGGKEAVCAPPEKSLGMTLLEQAQELRAVAADWYRQARQEYHDTLQEAEHDEKNRTRSGG